MTVHPRDMDKLALLRGEPDNRLRWRCRRGMLELDVMLQQFLRRGFGDLDAAQRAEFVALLDYPDPELLDMLLGRVPLQGGMADVIAKIRASARS